MTQSRSARGAADIGMRTAGLALGAALFVTGTCMPVSPAAAQQSPSAQRGLTFVRLHCAECHAIDLVSESPLKIAPPFRTLHQQFPVETLRRRLAEGITASHPTMPQFRLDADQINDVIDYLKTLER
jgi:mono/diheme cytochrome c family protein